MVAFGRSRSQCAVLFGQISSSHIYAFEKLQPVAWDAKKTPDGPRTLTKVTMPPQNPRLFHELFQYRQRERRAPLEDFLTAALVGFIRTLPWERQIEFTAAVFLASSNAVAFVDLARRWSRHRWDLQFSLPNGRRPDIVLWGPNGPAIIIENKIWSGIRVYGPHDNEKAEADDGGENPAQQSQSDHRDQLVTYGRWLSNARAGLEWPGSIVLLTHGTQPPIDFNVTNQALFGAMPHVCRWSTVHAWLKRYCDTNMPTEAVSKFLAGELVGFLEMKGLTMAPLKYSDVGALGTYLASRQQLILTFQETLAALRATYPNPVADDRSRAYKLDNSGPVVYGWVYLKQDNLPADTFFAWGIRFPQITGWWREFQNQLPEEEHLFCYFGSDSKAFSLNNVPSDNLPAGWLIVDEGKHFLDAAALPELPAAPTLQAAITQWAVQQLGVLSGTINYLAQ